MLKGSILIIISLAVFSCQQKSECNLAETIFAKPDTTQNKLFTLNDIWSMSDSLEMELCKNRNELNPFFLETSGLCVPFSITIDCNEGAMNCGQRQRNVLEIAVQDFKINGEQSILFENEVISIKELDSVYRLAYLNNGKSLNYADVPHKTIVFFAWKPNSDKNFVAEVLRELLIANARIINAEIPDTVENKCNYFQNNRKMFKSKYPFKLSIGYYGRDFSMIPPPPPPPF
jgi:hypothetical protein